MSFKVKIDEFIKKSNLSFYIPLFVSCYIFYTRGDISFINFKLPIYVGIALLGIAVYSYFLLEQDYKFACMEYEKAISQPQPQPTQVFRPQTKIDVTQSSSLDDDEFNEIMRGMKQ